MTKKDSLAGAGRICDCLHFDLHSVPESEPDIILAVDGNEVNEAVELFRVKFCDQFLLLSQAFQKLLDP